MLASIAIESHQHIGGWVWRQSRWQPRPIGARQDMRILVATDAWHPQISGVVRTLESLAKAVRVLGSSIDFLTPEGFASLLLPTYPGLRCALPRPGAVRSEERRVGKECSAGCS